MTHSPTHPSSDKKRLSPPKDWPKELRPHLVVRDKPGPDSFYGISHNGVSAVAALHKCSTRDAMFFCLEQDVWPLRFTNNRGFFSSAEQAALIKSRAAIIGCGGLGGHMALLLVRAGVGGITLCDYDSFDESNLNRQAFCREDRIGMNKAWAGAEEIRLTASHVAVEVHASVADAATLPAILRGADVAADCLDDLDAKRLLEKHALSMGIPFVHGAIAGAEAFALASRPGGTEALSLLYGDKTIPKNAAAEYRLGVPTPVPFAASLMQALLILRLLTGKPFEPANLLWHFDLAVPELELLRF